MSRGFGMMCACLVVALLAGCGEGPDSYLPPFLGAGADGLTISDAPLGAGDSAAGAFPDTGAYLGYLFQARSGERYDITLERVSGHAVPAVVLYSFGDGGWGEAIAWASADAGSIGLGGWVVPATGTYLLLVDVVSADHDGSFRLTMSCTSGCSDPVACASDADCAADEVCWNGLCFAREVECNSNADCRAGEICDQGFCVTTCDQPQPEICNGMDDDCDGLVDEDCSLPCRSNADCAAGEVCDAATGTCRPDGCTDDDGDGFCREWDDCDDLDPTIHPAALEVCDGLDNDCDGQVDEGCGTTCSADVDCAAGEVCVNGMCVMFCRSDTDCPAGQQCDASTGLCVSTCAGPEVCNGLDDDCDGLVDEGFDLLNDPRNCGGCGQVCASGESCLDGVCIGSLPCSSDSDCPTGQVCDAATRTCVALCGCASDADCAMGQVCIDCQCVPNGCDDADGDGFLAMSCGGEDCDDADASVNPAAPETCDGLDNDCDGEVDEDCGGACSSDNDCASGELCYNGVCVMPCRTDAECAAGQVCVAGVCTAP